MNVNARLAKNVWLIRELRDVFTVDHINLSRLGHGMMNGQKK